MCRRRVDVDAIIFRRIIVILLRTMFIIELNKMIFDNIIFK